MQKKGTTKQNVHTAPTTSYYSKIHQPGAKQVADYLKAHYEINVPADFVKQLIKEHCRFHASYTLRMKDWLIDTIVESCAKWKPYISKESFPILVCNEILSFVRIRTSVIDANYIGQKPELQLTKEPPKHMTTIVTKTGTLVIL